MKSTENRTCLVVAPHPADELFVAGKLIPPLVKRGWKVSVLFSTNGDSGTRKGTDAMRDALSALKILGVDGASVLFLGYGDGWKGKTHLYNAVGTVPLESAGGRHETFGLPEHPEFRFQKSGYHSVYTRMNYKEDLKDAILEIRADVLISVDFDSNPDHRCLSLMLEEALGEILREHKDYRPLVLKKVPGADGLPCSADGIRRSARALLTGTGAEDAEAGPCGVPFYSPDGMLRFETPLKTGADRFRKNPLYRAARRYGARGTRLQTDRILDTDAVYWPRRTDSLSYRASFSVSSGDPSHLGDFKLVDCPDVLRLDSCVFGDCVWTPEPNDAEKSVTVSFPEPATVSCLVFYENFSSKDHILNGTVCFDNGFVVTTGPLNPYGAGTKVDFEPQKNVRSLIFRITESSGALPGLTELEIYEDGGEPDYAKIAPLYDPELSGKNKKFSIGGIFGGKKQRNS